MDYTNLTDDELIKLHEETKIEISNCDVFQLNKKILLNSLYGSLANRYSRFYNLKNAEAITLTGQLAVSWVEKKFNEYISKILGEELDYVIAIDTDSCMLDFSGIANLFKEKFNLTTEERVVDYLCAIADTKFNDMLDKAYLELKEVMNFYKHKLHMKRECVASRGFYTTKKRYALKVHDSEGVRYTEPSMKIMGLESQRSSTPIYFRDKLERAFSIILSEDNDAIIRFVSEVKENMKNHPPEEIAFNVGVNNIDNYYKPYGKITERYKLGTPVHVKASIFFNFLVETKKLDKRYEYIKNGDKIKYFYLKKPNPMHVDVIAFQETLPPEFELTEYLDYSKQFEKAFEKPLQKVLDCFGWNTYKTNNILSIF